MKTKTIGVVLLIAVALFTVGVRPANAVLVYGIVWEDLNGNGIRDTGENGTGMNGITVTLTRNAGGGFGGGTGFETQNTTSLSKTIGGIGTFSVTGGGYLFDMDWAASPYNEYGDLTGTYTITISLPGAYSGYTTTRVGTAPGGFVGAGVSGGNSVNGYFGSPAVYPDTSDTSGFDSDVDYSTGTYSFSIGNNVDAFRVDIGLTPVPEPANVALAVFAGLAVGGSIFRRIRAKKSQNSAALALS